MEKIDGVSRNRVKGTVVNIYEWEMSWQGLESDSNSEYYSNYTESCLAVNGLMLGKVSNIGRVKLCPLFDKHRTSLATGCRTHRASKPFIDCDYAILIGVSNIKKVTRFTGL